MCICNTDRIIANLKTRKSLKVLLYFDSGRRNENLHKGLRSSPKIFNTVSDCGLNPMQDNIKALHPFVALKNRFSTSQDKCAKICSNMKKGTSFTYTVNA